MDKKPHSYEIDHSGQKVVIKIIDILRPDKDRQHQCRDLFAEYLEAVVLFAEDS
jgi:hypothetical protein